MRQLRGICSSQSRERSRLPSTAYSQPSAKRCCLGRNRDTVKSTGTDTGGGTDGGAGARTREGLRTAHAFAGVDNRAGTRARGR